MDSMQSPSHFLARKRNKIFRIVVGFLLVFSIAFLIYVEPYPIANWIATIENLSYDFQVQKVHKSVPKDTPILIVEIDDQSLQAVGRWPWPRNTTAKLVSNLFKNGAAVVALDMTFPEPEDNIAQEIIDETGKERPTLASELETVKGAFDYDLIFSKSLQQGQSLLGTVFLEKSEKTGVLSPPLLHLSTQMAEQLNIPDKKGYLANIELLAKGAQGQGFLNATPDLEGILRFTPLLLRYGLDVYGSLALEAALRYLHQGNLQLLTAQYKDSIVLEGVRLGDLQIPTDATGRVLIPFRGPPYSFPYVSAIDVIRNSTEPKVFKDKLVFIGCTAAAIGDIKPAAISPVFPGVEVQATIAAGIVDHYFPFKPTWGKGVSVILVALLGSLCALAFPFLGIGLASVFAIALPIALIVADYWLWSSLGMVLSIVFPIGAILLLFILNAVWGYLFETGFAKTMKSIFGHYVPDAYLDQMIKHGGEFGLEGESKELTVLFSDIRDFTSISEKMNPRELKQFINRYFNKVTEVILGQNGTVDKYVGDMIMAFWGAPLDNPKHAFSAVSTALAIQKALNLLNQEEQYKTVHAGIGINTGMMNVGDMGSQFRRAYTVIGDAVNLASRLESLTKIYRVDILVGETTFAETKDDFAYRKIDRVKVKGKEQAVDAYCPICRREEATPQLLEELQNHHRALEAYFQKQWDVAESYFSQNVEKMPLYKIYLERIQAFRAYPPPPNWDGSFLN